MGNYRWSPEDDYICCRAYLEFVFVDGTSHSLSEMVEMLHLKLPRIDKGSLRMKLQNIKQVALDEGLEDSLDISPLSRYSRQCHKAFGLATDDLFEETGRRRKSLAKSKAADA